jgi:hypothetical protein
MVIRRVGVMSAAKVGGALYAAIGLLIGCVFAAISLIGAGFIANSGNHGDMPPWFASMFGVAAIVVAPIFYGVMGLIGAAVGAWVYNLIAGLTGGLELDVQ